MIFPPRDVNRKINEHKEEIQNVDEYEHKPKLRSGMSLVVNFLQSIGCDMRINLRCREARVTKQFLHGAKISAGVQHMRGKRMTQPID